MSVNTMPEFGLSELKLEKDRDLERAILGGLIQEPDLLRNEKIRKIGPSDFYHKENREIYKAIECAYKLNGYVDVINITNQLKGRITDPAYTITGLLDECPSPALVPSHCENLMNMASNNATMKTVTKFKQGQTDNETLIRTLESRRIEKLNQSDSGNAELFFKQHGDKVRYNHSRKKWHIFNEIYWKVDEKQAVHQLAKETARSRQKNALTIQDTREKDAEIRFALKSEDFSKIISMLNSAKSMRGIRTTHEDWDNLDMIFQCSNALIDLCKVERIDIKPEYMISQNSGVYYDPDEDCPTFKECLLEWMNNDIQMCKFIQRVMGYCLTGKTDEQCLFWLVGPGANGKSILLDVLAMLYGDYQQDTGMGVFMKKYNRNNSNDLARLFNARVVTANESAEGRRVDEERVKLISGGDSITARFLHQEFFTYESHMKLIFATNELPRVKDFSEGFWRRVRIVPFERCFSKDEIIPRGELLETLQNELSGILNYALAGLRHYHQQGLNPPQKVYSATEKYRAYEDDVSCWFEDCAKKSENDRISSKLAYNSFKTWFEDNRNDKPITQQMFSRRMATIGYRSEKIGGKRFFLGITIAQDHRTF